ncbi:hypothetical protein [Roseateles sp.]|uniref:hypothetical protein n=1 Tax=Roseateles sp. TaxID=1971397 RepID=UPI0025F28DC1|nr:hypothetical protein [Roseateles sp.]MBV8036478.1 hypothetical protein [Roseateles sp.]
MGGTVAGLGHGESVGVLNNGADGQTVSTNGNFVFPTPLPTGSAYAATVGLSPDGKNCSTANGSGSVASGNVTNVVIDCSREISWVTNGEVLTTALSADGKTLFIGGAFTRVGKRSGSFVPLDATTAAVKPHAVVNGQVAVQLPDGNGGWYIGGNFSSVAGVARNNLAKLRSDGTLDTTFIAQPRSAVKGLALIGNTLYIGGAFGLAALDASTGAIRPWQVALNGPVAQIASLDNTVYFGGTFDVVNGVKRTCLAAVDGTTGTLAAWSPEPRRDNNTPDIRRIVASGSTVYVGGTFSAMGGKNRMSVAALDATSGAALSWDAALASPNGIVNVYDLAVDGAVVYVGGEFSTAGGAQRASIAALDAVSGAALPWSPSLTLDAYQGPTVSALAVTADSVILAGQFALPNSQTVQRFAAIDKKTGAPRNWIDSEGATVQSLTVVGNTVWAGGKMSLLGGQLRNGLAAIDTATGALTAWNPQPVFADPRFPPTTAALAVDGTNVYVAGNFTVIGGVPRSGLAKVDTSTGSVLPWNPVMTGGVRVLNVSNGTLYVAGVGIDSVNGQPRKNLAAFDALSGTLKPWAPDATSSTINAIQVSDSIVYVGGQFGTIAGQNRGGLAAFDSTSGALLPWDAGVTYSVNGVNFPTVNSMALLGRSLYFVGQFGNVSGQVRWYWAAVDKGNGALQPWGSNIALGAAPRAIVGAGDTLYIASGGDGVVESVGVSSMKTTGEVGSFKVMLDNGYVNSISLSDTQVYLGGTFEDIRLKLGGQSNDIRLKYQPSLTVLPR